MCYMYNTISIHILVQPEAPCNTIPAKNLKNCQEGKKQIQVSTLISWRDKKSIIPISSKILPRDIDTRSYTRSDNNSLLEKCNTGTFIKVDKLLKPTGSNYMYLHMTLPVSLVVCRYFCQNRERRQAVPSPSPPLSGRSTPPLSWRPRPCRGFLDGRRWQCPHTWRELSSSAFCSRGAPSLRDCTMSQR